MSLILVKAGRYLLALFLPNILSEAQDYSTLTNIFRFNYSYKGENILFSNILYILFFSILNPFTSVGSYFVVRFLHKEEGGNIYPLSVVFLWLFLWLFFTTLFYIILLRFKYNAWTKLTTLPVEFFLKTLFKAQLVYLFSVPVWLFIWYSLFLSTAHAGAGIGIVFILPMYISISILLVMVSGVIFAFKLKSNLKFDPTNPEVRAISLKAMKLQYLKSLALLALLYLLFTCFSFIVHKYSEYKTNKIATAMKTDIASGKPIQCDRYTPKSVTANNCYAKLALDTRDSSVCSKIPDETYDSLNNDGCYRSVAIELNDPGICEMIKDRTGFREFYHNCLAVTKKDSSICLVRGGDDEKSRCLIDVAVAENDAKVCSLVTGEIADWCYSKAVPLLKDKEACNLITSKPIRNSCISDVATALQDINMCIQINKDETVDKASSSVYFGSVENCLSQIKINDRASCSNLTKRQSDICLQNFFVTNNDIESCTEITTDALRNGCYEGIAVVRRDISICNKLDKDYSRNLCYNRLASMITDPTQCGLLPIPQDVPGGGQDGCYQIYAVTHQDPSVCKFIVGDFSKKYCEEHSKTELR